MHIEDWGALRMILPWLDMQHACWQKKKMLNELHAIMMCRRCRRWWKWPSSCITGAAKDAA